MSAVYWFSASCLYFHVMDCFRGWGGLWLPWGEGRCWPCPPCFWGESRWTPPCCWGLDVTDSCLFRRRFRATAAGERGVPFEEIMWRLNYIFFLIIGLFVRSFLTGLWGFLEFIMWAAFWGGNRRIWKDISSPNDKKWLIWNLFDGRSWRTLSLERPFRPQHRRSTFVL